MEDDLVVTRDEVAQAGLVTATRRFDAKASAFWLLRRLPRIVLNLFLIAVIVGLLIACYAPVYFGPDATDRAPRRAR